MKPKFRLPFDTNRHGTLTATLRRLLVTTAASWMEAAQSKVPALVAEPGKQGVKHAKAPERRCNQTAMDTSWR